MREAELKKNESLEALLAEANKSMAEEEHLYAVAFEENKALRQLLLRGPAEPEPSQGRPQTKISLGKNPYRR